MPAAWCGTQFAGGLHTDYDGVQIGPKVGSCGTAAWRREAVVVRDIQSDLLWDDYKEIAARFNLRSCWSTPLVAADGMVLGHFALYSETVREPGADEIRLTSMASDLAGIAIERARNEQKSASWRIMIR